MGLKGREVVGWSPSGLAGQVLSSFRVPRPLPSPAHPAQTHVPQVEGDFQLTPEAVCKCRVQVQHLQQVCTLDLVQVTVGQGPHICTGLARPGVKANGLPKDVVLTCQPEGQGFLQGLAPRCPWKSLPEGPLITNPPPTSRPLRGGGGGQRGRGELPGWALCSGSSSGDRAGCAGWGWGGVGCETCLFFCSLNSAESTYRPSMWVPPTPVSGPLRTTLYQNPPHSDFPCSLALPLSTPPLQGAGRDTKGSLLNLFLAPQPGGAVSAGNPGQGDPAAPRARPEVSISLCSHSLLWGQVTSTALAEEAWEIHFPSLDPTLRISKMGITISALPAPLDCPEEQM